MLPPPWGRTSVPSTLLRIPQNANRRLLGEGAWKGRQVEDFGKIKVEKPQELGKFPRLARRFSGSHQVRIVRCVQARQTARWENV